MKVVTNPILWFTIQILFAFFDLGAVATGNGHTHQLWKDVFSPSYHANVPSLHIRQDGRFSTNVTQNSTVLEAERIVKAAQEEARIRNKYLVEHVRKNKYEFRYGSAPTSKDTTTATGVNETVANAAALLTEYLARNGTTKMTLAERQASSYWMENMLQNGNSPYAGVTGYKVCPQIYCLRLVTYILTML